MKPYIPALVLLGLSLARAEDTELAFEAWVIVCPESGACVLEQRVFLEGNDTSPLIQVAFQMVGQPPHLFAAVRTPLGVLVGPGVQMSIDGRASRTFAFHHCRTDGCLALFPVTAELRERLERGREGRIQFHLADGRRLGVPLSLLGITAGFRHLEETAR